LAVVVVGIAVIVAVIMVTGGVVAQSDSPDILAFYGVSVRTTSAQIFLTGAICTWALLAASWLLCAGIRRSRERGEQLAALKERGGSLGEAPEHSQAPALAELFGLAAVPVRASGVASGGCTVSERRVAERPGARHGRGDTGPEQNAPE
jgi:hypothetical protein